MSVVERLLALEGMEPYEGEYADKLFLVTRETIRGKPEEYPPFSDGQIRDAVRSLGALNKAEADVLFRIQDRYCQRCGNCCRTEATIDFMKADLQRIARRQHTSYGKLKRRIRAYKALGAGRWSVPGKPCPFFKEPNICKVYSLRPYPCRLYPLGKTITMMYRRDKKAEKVAEESCPAISSMNLWLVIGRLMYDHQEGLNSQKDNARVKQTSPPF